MNKPKPEILILIIVIILLAVFLLWEIDGIPFHPDETSILYQTRDFELYISNPLSLSWDPENADDPEQIYRSLNPPLPKYILGFSRWLAGFSTEDVANDWDWTLSWQENEARGAVPDPILLRATRVTSTLFVILSLLFIYLVGAWIGGRATGILAVILLGTHALLVLHGRRAMAEGIMTFGITFALYGMLQGQKRPWLAGLTAAIAASTKLSVFAIVPISFLGTIWLTKEDSNRPKRITFNVVVFILVFIATFLVLNPILWGNPISGARIIWSARTEFLEGQITVINAIEPGQIMDTPLERIVILMGHLFIADPQIAEAGNYLQQTKLAADSYLGNPIYTLSRGMILGGLSIYLCLMGVVFGTLNSKQASGEERRGLMLVLLATLAMSLAILIANPIPYQRYYVPLIPFICLWISYGIIHLFNRIKLAAVTRTKKNGPD
ncbi:MAG: phospholipid carrier-dependent glycosyltransferase [Anaerolineales bacterium]|nr:phospholipid carrier-dependent glycosyltransferase [Anaerolineales bacterium]